MLEENLFEYGAIVQLIDLIKSEINEIESLKSAIIDDMPKGSRSTSSSIENELLLIEKKKNQIESLKKIKEKYEKKFEVLNDKERLFIQLRYVDDLTYNAMSKILDMNEFYLPNKKNKILKKLR